MAGSSTYTVVLDACVLYPAPLRDLLLSLSVAGLFRARWTCQINDEWTHNLLENRRDLKLDDLSITIRAMNDAIEDCLIENYEYLINSLSLPDLDDRHVLAAAIVGHADAIVTYNLKDFPSDKIALHGIEILHPDDFFMNQYDLDPVKALTSVKDMRARLKKPPKSAEELIETLEAQSLVQTSAQLRKAIHLI